MSIEATLDEILETLAELKNAARLTPEALNQHQAGEILGCHPNTVAEYEKRGLLRRVEWADRPKYPKNDVVALANTISEQEARERVAA